MKTDELTPAQAVELVKLIANQLGWAPPLGDRRPIRRVREYEANKIMAKVAENPKLYTWANLELAIVHMRQQRITPKSPVAVVFYVEKALHRANAPDDRPIGDRVASALAAEYEHELPGWEEWTRRLNVAFGTFRQEVYEEWLKERGPLCV